MMYSKETLEKVRQKADIVTYLESKGTPMRVTGTNFVGLCPFHEEKTPSFNVRPGVQRFRCFGCGENGDIFNLVQHIETLSFVGAVQFVAEAVDMLGELEEIDDEAYRKRKRLHRSLQLTTAFYREQFLQLPNTHPAKHNLAERQLLDFALEDESIGYAPAGELAKLLLNGTVDPEDNSKIVDKFTVEELVEVGLLKYQLDDSGQPLMDRPPKEVFRNRLMWTVYDIAGRPVGFSGRNLDDNDSFSPKYLNSPQTLLYNKSKALLGLNFARKSITEERSVIIVEGQTDVMAFQAAGLKNVVASCGTAFGQQHVDILTRLAATSTRKGEQFTFIFCMDADAAGVKSVMSVFEKIPEIQMNSQVVTLKDPTTGEMSPKSDPCDYRNAFGDEALKHQLNSSVSIVEFVLKQELTKWNILTPEGRTGFVNAARPVLALIQDSLAHDAYLRKISYWTGVPYSQLVDAVRHRKQFQPQQNNNAEASSEQQQITIDEKMYAAFLQYPTEMTEVWQEKNLDLDYFANPTEAEDVILNLPPDSPHMFTSLNVPEGEEKESLQKLVDKFLHLKYMDAIEDLNAQMHTSADMDSLGEEGLLQMIMKQQQLKVRYQQL